MAEKCNVSRHYHLAFDPPNIPTITQPNNNLSKVSMMLPITIMCTSCGTNIYRGTKFISHRENVFGQTHPGMEVFRFYFRCPRCSAEITIRACQRIAGCVVESGAVRNYEPAHAQNENPHDGPDTRILASYVDKT